MLAFEIDGYRNDYIYCFKNYPNPYSVDVTESYDTLETHRIPNYLKQEYDYYDEDFEYRLGGGLRSYTLKGLIENGDGSLKQDEIYKVLFDYREQGTLWKKEYWYNEDLFNTYDARSQYYIYDELERLQYVGLGYDESPTEEYYLCYEGDSMTPFSYLTLSKRYLEMGCIEVSDYAETYFPKDGINAFLQQAGLTRNDIFYQYQWHNEDSDGVLWTHSDSCLTLYCDKERGVGCGYLEYPKEYSPFMRGFIFKGDVKVDCSKTDPYAVYAEYGCDDSISIHNWSFEEFQKDQSSFYCDYDDKGRILRTLVIGNRDIERFYIYEGDNELPSYCFNIVHGSSSGVTLFEFD